MMTRPSRLFFFFAVLFLLPVLAVAAEKDDVTVSAMGLALAPNAGGQFAYALRGMQNNREIFGFANTYLTTGSLPLSGAGYSLRFPICEKDCFWQFYAQAGGGFSTAGPFVELLWGMTVPLLPIWLPTDAPRFYPQLRVDVATHLIGNSNRVITWSYPLWLGLAFKF